MENKINKRKSIGLPGGPNEYITHISQVFSTEGYRSNSPDKDNPFNVINSSSITMTETNGEPLKKGPLFAMDNLGNSKLMMPGNDYQFPGDQVFEVPMAQDGKETEKSIWDIGTSYLNPYNWGVDDYTDMGSFDNAYAKAKKAGEKEFIYNYERYNVEYDGSQQEELDVYGINAEQATHNNWLRNRIQEKINADEGSYGYSGYSEGGAGDEERDKQGDKDKLRRVFEDFISGDEHEKHVNDPLTQSIFNLYLGLPIEKNVNTKDRKKEGLSLEISDHSKDGGLSYKIDDVWNTIAKNVATKKIIVYPDGTKIDTSEMTGDEFKKTMDEFWNKQDSIDWDEWDKLAEEGATSAELYKKFNIPAIEHKPLNKNGDYVVDHLSDFILSPQKEELNEHYNLGKFYLRKGEDKKGKFISYYDKWDLHPTNQDKSNLLNWAEQMGWSEDQSQGVGKPLQFYDKKYYTIDDKGRVIFEGRSEPYFWEKEWDDHVFADGGEHGDNPINPSQFENIKPMNEVNSFTEEPVSGTVDFTTHFNSGTSTFPRDEFPTYDPANDPNLTKHYVLDKNNEIAGQAYVPAGKKYNARKAYKKLKKGKLQGEFFYDGQYAYGGTPVYNEDPISNPTTGNRPYTKDEADLMAAKEDFANKMFTKDNRIFNKIFTDTGEQDRMTYGGIPKAQDGDEVEIVDLQNEDYTSPVPSPETVSEWGSVAGEAGVTAATEEPAWIRDFRFTPADIAFLNADSDYCPHGQCLDVSWQAHDKLSAGRPGIPTSQQIKASLGMKSLDADNYSYDWSMRELNKKSGQPLTDDQRLEIDETPYFDAKGLDFTADSWDIHGLLVDKGGTNIWTAGVHEPGAGHPRSSWKNMSQQEKEAVYAQMPVGTIVGYGWGDDAFDDEDSEYKKGMNLQKGLASSNHSTVVIGYDTRGVPVIYDYENYTPMDQYGLNEAGMPGTMYGPEQLTNITYPKGLENKTLQHLKDDGLFNTQPKKLDLNYDALESELYSKGDREVLVPFHNSLVNNKNDLMNHLNLSEKDYDMISAVLLAQTMQESSGGDSFEDNWIPHWYSEWRGDTQGLTQLNIDNILDDPELKKVAKKFGITEESDLFDPEKSAIASVIYGKRNLKSGKKNYEEGKKGPGVRTFYPRADIREDLGMSVNITYNGDEFKTDEGVTVNFENGWGWDYDIDEIQEQFDAITDKDGNSVKGKYRVYEKDGDILVDKNTLGNVEGLSDELIFAYNWQSPNSLRTGDAQGESEYGKNVMRVYKKLRQANKQMGGQILGLNNNQNLKKYNKGGHNSNLKIYKAFFDKKIKGPKAEKVYDKLNRVYYAKAKEEGMSSPNYILTHVIT